SGGSEEYGVYRACPRLHYVGRYRFGRELEASEVLPQPFESPWRAVDGDDAGAGGRELGGLATRRRAQIRDAAPAHVAEELRRQRRGGVLHPPGALGIARELRYRSVRDRAHRAGRQHASAERPCPMLGIVLYRQIERRLLPVGDAHRA